MTFTGDVERRQVAVYGRLDLPGRDARHRTTREPGYHGDDDVHRGRLQDRHTECQRHSKRQRKAQDLQYEPDGDRWTRNRPPRAATPMPRPSARRSTITASSVSGVLYNDFYTDPATGKQVFNSGLTAVKLTDPSHGALSFNSDGSFTYTPDGTLRRQRQRQLHLPGQGRQRQPVECCHGQHPHPVGPARLQDPDELRAGHALHRLRVLLLLHPAALQLHRGAGGEAPAAGEPGLQCGLPAPARGGPEQRPGRPWAARPSCAITTAPATSRSTFWSTTTTPCRGSRATCPDSFNTTDR